MNEKFIKIYAENYPNDYPEPEAIVAAIIHRGKIKEVPVIMKERIGGSSSINLKRSVYYMIKVTMASIVCRISFGILREKKIIPDQLRISLKCALVIYFALILLFFKRGDIRCFGCLQESIWEFW